MIPHPIRFYGKNQPYGFLSNFHPAPVTLAGESWPTTEHYYQAQKSADPQQQATIRQAETPGEAAQQGRAITPLPDCLLYTSPSPRDRTRYRMPSSACKQ